MNLHGVHHEGICHSPHRIRTCCMTFSAGRVVFFLFCSLFPPPTWMDGRHVFSRCVYFSFANRCGQEEQNLAHTQEKLFEFARRNWRNKAFRQMSYNLFPPPNSFREPTMVAPPQDLEQPATVKLMPVVQRILGSYTAVCVCLIVVVNKGNSTFTAS